MGHRDPRGHLQHADVAGGAGGREGEARPCASKPDGSPHYGMRLFTGRLCPKDLSNCCHGTVAFYLWGIVCL